MIRQSVSGLAKRSCGLAHNLTQLAQLEARFRYFRGFCTASLESDQLVRRCGAGISACSANLGYFLEATSRIDSGACICATPRYARMGRFIAIGALCAACVLVVGSYSKRWHSSASLMNGVAYEHGHWRTG